MKKIIFVLALLLVGTLMQSCVKDPVTNSEDEVAPKLPPQEAFVMPFDGFESADTTKLSGGRRGARNMPTYFNWFYSVSNVVVWNAVVGLNMVIPVASFGEAFNHDPTYQGNGIWLWSYSYDVHGQTYEAELTGQFINDEEIQWDMNITQVGGFSKVHWYRGTTANDGSYATWTVNHQPDDPEPYLRIDYKRGASEDEGSLRYTNIIPNDAGNGDYIEFRAEEGGAYNRAYDVFDASEQNLLQIEWHETNHNGRVRNPDQFGNDRWQCWSVNFTDMICP